MGFFKSNTNAFLILVVIITVAALSSASVYYQDTFRNLTSDYDEKSSSLSYCEARLEQQVMTLNRTLESLNASSADIKKYDELYAEKTELLTSTSEELTSTKSTLDTTQASLQDYQNKYTTEKDLRITLESSVNKLTAEKQALQSEVSDLNSQIAVKTSKINRLEGDVEDLEAQLAACGP